MDPLGFVLPKWVHQKHISPLGLQHILPGVSQELPYLCKGVCKDGGWKQLGVSKIKGPFSGVFIMRITLRWGLIGFVLGPCIFETTPGCIGTGFREEIIRLEVRGRSDRRAMQKPSIFNDPNWKGST